MGAGHDHAHSAGEHLARSTARARRLSIAIALNVGIVVVQIAAGIVAGSLGLIADAAHNLTDVLALVVSLVAVRLTRRPATAARSFGWHRATILAALFNAASVLAVCVFVLVEAVRRLGDPQPIDGGVVIAAAAAGAVVNLVAAFVVFDRSDDLNMRSALLHLLSDAATSVAVALTGAVMLATGGWYWLDPAVAVVIAVVIGWQGWGLASSAVGILLEGTPEGSDPEAIAATILATDGVDAVHDLHVWSISSEIRALSAHVVVSGHPTLEEAQAVARDVKHHLHDGHRIAHATIELECEPCAEEPRCLDDVPVPAHHAGHAH